MYLFLFIALLFCSCFSEKELDSVVVARVNKKTLTKKGLSDLVGPGPVGPKRLFHATNRWVENTLLYNAAVKAGLKKDKKLINQKDRFYVDLLVSSYLQIKAKDHHTISKKEISDYYNKNKKSFIRKDDAVSVKHFIIQTKKEAEAIKKKLIKNRDGKKIEKIIKDHRPENRLLTKNKLKDSLVDFVFAGKAGDVLGPKKHGGFYHLFQVLKTHKKGGLLGLEVVYDEIYKRLYKQKESVLLTFVVDSLYSASDVFISPEVFE